MIYKVSPSIHINIRDSVMNIVIDHDKVVSFDGEGRLLTFYDHGKFFKRGLDHRIVEKSHGGKAIASSRIRRDLVHQEKFLLIVKVRNVLRQIMLILPGDAPAAVRDRLDRALLWDEVKYLLNTQDFKKVYHSPVAILPPDQYLALVLQATEGCHYNQCLFCNFYRGTSFHIKSIEEFKRHVRSVQGFIGEGRSLRHTIFLGDANALAIPQRQLLPLFKVIHDEFEVAPGTLNKSELHHWKAAHPQGIVGIYSFQDAFTGKQKTVQEFAALAELGLRRVYIGMETGYASLLDLLRKPSDPQSVHATVRAAKAAGLEVGIIVMLGIGGKQFAQGHVAATIMVLNGLPLDTNDIIYFSELVDMPNSKYSQVMELECIEPLNADELKAQALFIRSGLKFTKKPHLSTYNVREFIY